MVTAPLQLLVTVASAFILKTAGYLISRDGVILHMGDYTIVVGEACSGLRSLISLMAVGAIYTYLQKITCLKRTVLLLLIIPISIIANLIRLIALALITYYFGDAAGQGFSHNFSGFVLFIIALGCLVVVDVLLDRKSRVVNG
jgi:exosortase